MASPALQLPAIALGLFLAFLVHRHTGRRLLTGALLFLCVLLVFQLLQPVYSPHRGFLWLPIVWSSPARSLVWLPATLALSSLLLAVAPLLGRRTSTARVAHGSARYATHRDLESANLLESPLKPDSDLAGGIVLGRLGRRLIVDRSEHHLLLSLATGAGKTTGPIINTALANTTDSMLILDPKSEIYKATAAFRIAAGHRCFRFDPANPDRTDRWNPFDEVDPRQPTAVGHLQKLAANLLVVPSEAPPDHWIARARELFVGLALHVLLSHDQPSLAAVRDHLAGSGDDCPESVFEEMINASHDPNLEQDWIDPHTTGPTEVHPQVLHVARSMLSTPPKERGSIVSSLSRYLALWADPYVAANSSTSTFSTHALANRSRPTTLYVTFSYTDLERLGPLLRLLLSQLIYQVTTAPPPHRSARRLLLILDELPAIGRLPILEGMLAFLRGYRVRVAASVQDINQLVRIYGRHQTLQANSGILLFGGTNDQATRKLLSDLSGAATVRYHRSSRSARGAFSSSKSTGEADTARPLLTAGEAGQLPLEQLALIKQGMPLALIHRHLFFEDPILRDRARHEFPS